jgi:hypothetical protein
MIVHQMKGEYKMIIENEDHKTELIEESDLQFMGKALLRLTQVLREEVWLGDDNDTFNVVKELEHYGKLIILQDYNKLINDTSVIECNGLKDEESGNYYLDMSRCKWGNNTKDMMLLFEGYDVS